MKTLVIILLLFATYSQSNAQQIMAKADNETPAAPRREAAANKSHDWEFVLALEDYSTHAYAKAHAASFGRDIARLLSVMNERYVRKLQVVGGDPSTSTRIQKPAIYNAVKKIEKHYRAKARQVALTAADVATFEHVIKVAIACLEEDSTAFEAALKQCGKNTTEQIKLFQRVKLNNIYE